MNASQYLRNVGKSMGYIAIDGFKNLAPNTSALFSNAKDFSSDLYQTINDFKGKAVGSGTDSIKSSIKNTASETWKNARDDFLSGKWYNKERKDAAADQMLKDMGFDFDFDFDFDDFGDAFDETDKATVEQSQKETEAVIGTINGSVASAANTVASVTAKSTDYLASVQNANAAAMYELNTQGFNNVNLGMNAINANISALVSLAKPLTDHMQNSAVFYAKSTEYQQKTVSLLEQLVKNTTPVQKKRSSGKASFEDYISDSGIDLARLFGDMKENSSKTIKEYKELFAMLGGGKGLTGDITASPISFLMSNLLFPQLLGKKNVKSIKGIDDMLKAWGFNALQKGAKKFNNSLAGGILSVFGIELPELTSKTKIDTGKYIQGKIDWDGQSKKALTEVIPYYLAKMTAIMDGSGDMEVFDYSKGTFSKRSKLRSEYDKEKRRFAENASSGLYNKVSKTNLGVSRDELTDFTLLLMEEGLDYSDLIKGSEAQKKEYYKNHPKIKDYLKRHPGIRKIIYTGGAKGNTTGSINKFDMTKFTASIGEQIGSRNNQYKRWEEEGSMFDFIFNGSTDLSGKGGGGIFGRDASNYSALDYLRGIYLNTFNISVKTTKKGKKAPTDMKIPDRVEGSSGLVSNIIESIKEETASTYNEDSDSLYGNEDRGPIGKLMSFIDDAVFGGAFSKDNIKNSFKKVGNKFKDFFIGPQDVASMYVGGVVRKTGLAALSEGEMVIPAQFNPYYKKSINKNLQRIREERAVGRFFGSFGDGTTYVGDEGEKKKFTISDDSFLGKSKNAMKEGFSEFGLLLFNLFAKSTGIDGDKVSFDEQKKYVANIIGSATDKIKGVVKEHGSDAIVGGIIGGGVSLLTGAAISPILGASLGAATGLVMGSEQVRDWLFGTDEKEGKLGPFGKKVRQFVEDQLPVTLMGGATGGAAGLLLGHPVIGMFLGAGAGFVSQSEKAKDFLFGEIDETTGERKGNILPATLQKKLRDAIPGASAGAISGVIATALGGPFGLVGNMMIGAGIGSVVTSEKFKDWFLGDIGPDGKREGGFITELRTNVFDPIREIFFNLSDRIRQDIRDLSIGFFNHARNLATMVANNQLVQSGITGVKKIGTGIKTGLSNLGIPLDKIKAPDLKGLSNKLRASNLASGFGVRDKSGKYLTAKERLNQIKLGGLKLTNKQANSFGMRSTEALAGMSMEDLRTLTDELSMVEGLKVKDRTSDFLQEKGLANLSDAQIRRLRESIKVEGKARGPIDVIRDGVEKISSTLDKIFKFGTGKGIDADKVKSTDNKSVVGGILKGSAQYDLTTAAGVEAKKESEEEKAKQDERDAVNKSIRDTLKNAYGANEDGSIADQSNKNKTGLFQKLFGEDSIIGKAAAFITKVGKWASAIGLGALILSTTGIFDKFIYNLSRKLGLDGIFGGEETGGFVVGGGGSVDNSKIVNFSWGTGFTQTDKETGETTGMNYEDISYKRTDTYSWSERAKEAIVRNIPRALKMAPHLLELFATKFADVMGAIFKIPIVKRMLGITDSALAGKNFVAYLIEKNPSIAKSIEKLTAQETAEFLSDLTAVINVAMAIIDFTAGWQDAEVTMNVSNPSMGQRLISGSLRAIKNLIPVVGVLIPDKLVIDAFVKLFGKTLGLDEYEAQRAAADAELEKYNLEHGTDFTWSQYVKAEDGLNKKTWTEKAWEGVKTSGAKIIGAITDPKQYFQNILSGTMEGFKSGDTLQGKLYGALAGFQDNALPGVIGDLGAITSRMWQYTADGDIKSLWAENFGVFKDSTDPIDIIFSNIPLIQNKLIMTPFALINRLILNVRDGFKEFDFGDNPFASLVEDSLNLSGHAFAGDIEELWAYSPNLNTNNKFIEGAWDVMTTINKVLYTPYTAVTWVVKKVWNALDAVKEGVKTGFNYLNEQGQIGADLIHSEDSSIEDLFELPGVGDDVPFGKLFDAATIGARILGVGVEVVKGAFRTIADMFTKEIGPEILHLGVGMAQDSLAVDAKAYGGDVAGLWQLKTKVNAKTDFVNGIGKVRLGILKVVNTPFAAVTTTLKLLVDGLIEQGGNAISTLGELGTDVSTMWDSAKSGEVLDVIGYDSPNINASGEHPIWGTIGNLALNVVKVPMTGISAVSWVGQKLGEIITNSIEGWKTIITYSKEQIEFGMSAFESNPTVSFDEFLNDMYQGINLQPDDPIEHVFNILTVGTRMIGAPVVMAKWAGQEIGNDIKETVSNVKTVVTHYVNNIKKGIDAASDSSSLEDFARTFTSDTITPEGPFEGLFFGIDVATRMIGLPIGLAIRVGRKVGDFIKFMVDGLKTDAETYSTSSLQLTDIVADDTKTYLNVFELEPQFNGPLEGIMSFGFGLSKVLYGAFKFVKGFIQDIKSTFTFQDLWDNLKSIANFKKDEDSGAGSGIGGGSSGFISQRDARYAGVGLGSYNVGQMGCGPAAASMVLGNSMSSNINLARKYQTAGGTDLAYFAEAFSRNGRTPIYYNLGGGASGTDMVRDIASGKPVVLMGRDPYNTSKANSPFGPNNHYVVARGFRNGGVVIDDPEASAGGMIYDPRILNSVTAAVSAGRSGLRRMTGIGGGGASINGTTDQIWAFFKGKGYADGAIAGILANIQSESSFSTTAVGDSGHAYGLCQWHDKKNSNSGRYANMLKTAQAMGRDVSDLTVQLTHIHNEIGQAGAGYPSQSDPYKAGYDFCVNFERPSNKDSKGKARGNLAKEFYSHYTGKNFSYSDNGGSSPSGPSGTSGFSSPSSYQQKEQTRLQKVFGFVSSLGSAFSNAANNSILGKFNIGNLFGSLISGSSSPIQLQSSEIFGDDGTGGPTVNNDVGVTQWPGKQPVEYMRDVLGKLTYSTKNRDPDKGGGDCSSTVAWALTKAGLPVTTDSRWQYVNQDGSKPSWQNVLWYNNGKPLGKGNTIPVSLQPNDVIFYSHGGSNYPDHVDHVEMYNGNNEIIGNGGGKGTRTRPVSAMQDQIIKIVRPNAPWSSASGSGLGDLAIRPKRVNTISKGGRIYNLSDYKRVATSGGATGLSGIDKSTALVLKSMITLIETLVKNTDDISAIYQLLSAYCAKNSDTKSAEVLTKLMSDRSTDNSRIEDNLADLKASVDAILAAG